MAKAMKSAAEAAQKWQQNFGAAGPAWSAGIESVTVAPGQLAAAASDRYLMGVQQNVQKFSARVAGVSLAQWKAASTAKGPARLAQGATVGLPKYQAQITRVLQTAQSIVASLPPRGTVEQNIQRSSQFQLQMHQAFQSGG